MVVSKAKAKDSKKRKQSPPPPPPQQPTAVESSPEMPKRTKVQAQRKFAQGQSAPASSYSALNAASSTLNTGPSTSSESREPPTEVLPDKRPKTEDFLTFLCFRGTPTLPTHLDFLNQGKAKLAEAAAAKKNAIKQLKQVKKNKKGRPPKNAAASAKNEEPKPSTSKDALTTGTVRDVGDKVAAPAQTVADKNASASAVVNEDNTKAESGNVMSFAVRKRAEVIAEGNRRGRTALASQSNVGIVADGKRRSNKAGVKLDAKTAQNIDSDGDEEYFSANDDAEKVEEHKNISRSASKVLKTPLSVERKSETPSKESETGKLRKGRPPSAAKKDNEAAKEALSEASKQKESPKTIQKLEPQLVKLPMKRPRQKESPIFIPSPEPSGRMTRQRAFFEPVKVPHRDEEKEHKEEEKSVDITIKTENIALANDTKTESEKGKDKKEHKHAHDEKATKTNNNKATAKSDKTESVSNNVENEKTIKQNLNVFDFSSDDEQPLAKTIKLNKSKTAIPRKNAARLTKAKKSSRKLTEKSEYLAENESPIKTDNLAEETKNIAKLKITSEQQASKSHEIKVEKMAEGVKGKNKRGKIAKKKFEPDQIDSDLVEDKDLLPPSAKKQAGTARQPLKRTKGSLGNEAVNGEEEKLVSSSAPVRNQRPTRKTKEAAAIYMGIIGHKLQLADDEDDDLSLNSFPDLPNVKEMEKMENELKKNAVQVAPRTSVTPTISVTAKASAATTKLRNSSPATAAAGKTTPKQSVRRAVTQSPLTLNKPQSTGRRGRPPKHNKQTPPAKRGIEGMLVKKGAITKLTATSSNVTTAIENMHVKDSSGPSRPDSEDEDFLLNEEVKETKRKLEKSFSDSDDEPLAIKAHVKIIDKDADHYLKKPEVTQQSSTPPATPAALAVMPVTSKTVSTPPPSTTSAVPIGASTSSSAVASQQVTSQAPSPFKTIEKKSPVPTSKILNVPATYASPSVNLPFNKTTSYLPQTSPHYHASHVRPPSAHQFPTAKSPTTPAPPAPTHLTAPLPPQSTIKYQTPPTTYPPPIEAYPSPKINPNFLTPKFDRASLPRTNNFPSPSPVKFDMASTAVKSGIVPNSILSSKTPNMASGTGTPTTMITMSASNAASTSVVAGTAPTTTVVSGTANNSSNDPLKDEIGSILAANLMPSKEESGKIFGIASVSLAQSSGPDNTKCTLGKCGSIHKPVLGPVVPTEGYIGDQLSSKERRKAKVNMTHEQIQKWLIECSSNPDEILDDLDDDYDDNLRPNLFTTTPPPTRDDKESTSFSSSSKATRDLGKSESAWSAKGPSLKAIPVVATSNRKEDSKQLDVTQLLDTTAENDKNSGTQAINLTQKSNLKQHAGSTNTNEPKTQVKERSEKKCEKKLKEDKIASTSKETTSKDNKQSNRADKEKEIPQTLTSVKATGKQSNTTVAQSQETKESPAPTTKPTKKKGAAAATTTAPTAATASTTISTTDKTQQKGQAANAQKIAANANSADANSGSGTVSKTQKRMPVYNQRTQKATTVELKETTTTSHKKTAPFSYGAFSADNEKSIYSFDKDDFDGDGTKPLSKPAFRRQSRRDSAQDESPASVNTPTTRASPAKKRAAAAAAEKANKDIANASQNNSVSLTLSPSENCKLVKVSLDAEKPVAAKATTSASSKTAKKTKKVPDVAPADGDSDSDGHTFYIPLQGSGAGTDGDGGIQGVAVKLGREGPDGPNQKVIMHATLVTKAQMGSNSKPLPDSMNVSDIVKTLMTSTTSSTTAALETAKKSITPASTTAVVPSTSTAAAATMAGASNSASNSLKNVPIGTVQPRFKASEVAAQASAASAATAPAPGGSIGLVRVNSNSSLFSGSAKSRIGAVVPGPSILNANKKFKDDTPIKMSNNTAFPRHDDPTQMVEAPIFRPTEKEFADPIEFIERITPIAARFGICKIIPPSTFKPECRISDEMRFTAYNQYVHKMLHRWGPSAKELSAIKKYLTTQSIVMNHPPWIGGMEVDLPRLYHTVQELGGLKEVIEKKKWARVAEEMCIPKLAQDRVTKLDDIYCKYLLPYDTLSLTERQKLFDEVEADWAKREARARRNADRFVNTESVSNEEDDVTSEDDEESEEEVDGVSMECIVKGRSMPLSQFYRIARNTMALWFKNTEPTVNEVEAEFWRHVAVRDSHVCVHSGSIDSSGWGYGFPSPGPKGKGSNYARHPWNLKVLTNNPGSVLRSLGPVMGVTVPTLHVGMLFSACCWYRDPHGLSWIEYLHTGASKLWYGIPDDQSANFRAALTSLIPTHCQNKTIWLPCDTVMVPPHMLTDRGVSLCRIEQKPGEFIVVFPRAYTSSLATGYVVSESVYFATTSWLDLAKDDFRDIHDSCEPAMFSLEQLLFALGYDQRVSPDTLQQMQPMLNEVYEKETAAREQLKAAGVTSTEKVHNEKNSKAKKQQPPFKSIESECDLCRANLYISMVKTEEGNVYCLQHALKNLNNGNIQAKQCKLIYAYNVEDIEILIKNLKEKIQQKRHAVVGKKHGK